jgi:DMSO/TMAO reductase YedYZ molybdopterin-dependent catalytic subunit
MDSRQTEGISLEELQLATRNHGMPLEALRCAVTPVGLHYLLIHYDIPFLDSEGWTLELGGLVERPVSLRLEELKARPVEELTVTMECAGNGRARLDPRPVSQPWLIEAVGTARWRGTPLRPLLEEAGLVDGAVEVLFSGADHGREGELDQQFQRSLSVEDALSSGAILAYEMNGAPLPPQHGFPLRLIVPGWYGMTSVKWLTRIDVLAEPFAGYQQAHSYRLRQTEDEEGVPLGPMLPRSLMVPPGRPEFFTRERIVDGPCVLEGRAWSGHGEIVSVEVSADGGESWDAAELGEQAGPWAWRAWTYGWEPAPGSYELCCRARDSAGNEQPVEPVWNLGGYANNAVQRVPVTVV